MLQEIGLIFNLQCFFCVSGGKVVFKDWNTVNLPMNSKANVFIFLTYLKDIWLFKSKRKI